MTDLTPDGHQARADLDRHTVRTLVGLEPADDTDAVTLAAIRERTGPRELSSRVSAMLRRQLEQDNLAALVDELTHERGRPLDLELVERFRREMAE
jgi:hypothetical protein